MRNPNGYGSVIKLSGNRRRPYVVRKTKGFDDRGYPEYLVIGYYPTREAGLIALAEFNKCPYDVDGSKISMSDLYEKWLERATNKLTNSTLKSLKSAYKHCKNIYNLKYREIRSYHMQDCIDNCGRGASSQWAIKNLFGHLDKYALELDVINKSYAQLVTAEPLPETSKSPFTDEEVNNIWALYETGFEWADSVLVFLYSGWRISELLGLKCENIDLTAGTMQGGVKTRSGKNRIVPIHSKIFKIVQSRFEQGNEYLFSLKGEKATASQYYTLWNEIMNKAGMKHTPHECRHTFRTRLDNAGANKVCIDRIMGHRGGDTGEKTYTHKTIEQLKEAIELIKN